MHVLIVPSWYPNDNNGINGSFFKEQAEILSNSGIRVTVFSLILLDLKTLKEIIVHPFKYKLFCLQNNKVNGVNTFYVNIPALGLTRFSIFYSIYVKLFKHYYNKIKNRIGRVDVVHAHSYKYAGYSMCRVFNNIPKVITEHSSNLITNNLNKNDIQNLRYVVQTVNKFICVSNSLKTSLIKHVGNNNNIIVIPNMVNSIFGYKCVENNSDVFIFSSVSGLVAGKRVDVLLRAFWQAFNNKPNVKLKIAGDGPLRQDLQLLIDELGLNNQVELLGQLERCEILKLYQQSNAFVMVSEYETFGLVYAESLICGLPSIGTKNGGANGILNCYGGFLCEINNIDDISNKMRFVYKNYCSFDRKRISDDAHKLFSDVVVSNKIIQVYNSVNNN